MPGFLAHLRRFFSSGGRSAAGDPVSDKPTDDLQRLRAGIDASSDAIFLVDVESLRFVDTNAAATRMLGYSREELLRMGPTDLTRQPPADVRKHYENVIANGGQTFEVQLVRKNGSIVPVEASRRPLFSEGKWYIVGVSRDLSEVKRIDRERVKSEARYHNLFDFNPLPMWVYDLETLAFLEVNQAAMDQYGYTRDEFLAMTIKDIRPAEDVNRVVAAARSRGPEFDRSGIWRHRTKTGKTIDVEITSHEVDFARGKAKLVLAHDVTSRLAAETALRASKERFELVARATNDIVWDWDLISDRRWFNENMTSLLGHERAALEDGPAYWGMHPDDVDRVAASLRTAITSNASSWSAEYRFRRADGEYLDIYDRGFVLRTGHGTPIRMMGAMMDITERKRVERKQHHLAEQLEKERERLVAAQAVAKVGSWETDLSNFDVAWSAETHRIFETDPATFHPTHQRFLQIVHPDDRAKVDQAFQESLNRTSASAIEHRLLLPDGRIKHVEERWQTVADHAGKTFRAIGTCQDITERKRTEAELTYHLTHDITTGLPRFAVIEGFLRSALVAAAAQDGRVVVLYVDLDYFHAVNETRGHAIGDSVLRTTAERLIAAVGEHGKVAHVAGDEFAMILTDTDGKHDQVEFAEAVRAAIAEPIEIDEQQIYVTCSIGVSCFPDNAASAQDLLRQAEAAMMRGKREGRNAVCAFSNDQNAELQVRIAMGSRLHDAIRDRQLVLHYQPQISGQNWQILGFEALARWQDPDLGLVSPKIFIQAAEELGLILDLGRFVLQEACRQARAWIDAGAGEFTISVNISSLQLQQPAFIGDVRAALAQFKLPPGCIELELTESAMMENVERMIETLLTLKRLGVRLALDDFGTGHSSLNHLRRFPIDCLKIDQSFVRDVNSDVGSAGICRAIITLGHQLGMQVLAEGVETAAQVGYLKRNDCDLFQGYYFSRAVSGEQAFEILRHRFLARDEKIAEDEPAGTLLIVDDETNILRALTRALRRDGYHLLTATSAEEALEVLGREAVHVIISDQRMPGISGTELLSKVKGLYPLTVRIVLSGYTDLAAVTEAINQGAIYKYLTKPWDDDELRMQIRDAFRKYKSRMAAAGEQVGADVGR